MYDDPIPCSPKLSSLPHWRPRNLSEDEEIPESIVKLVSHKFLKSFAFISSFFFTSKVSRECWSCVCWLHPSGSAPRSEITVNFWCIIESFFPPRLLKLFRVGLWTSQWLTCSLSLTASPCWPYHSSLRSALPVYYNYLSTVVHNYYPTHGNLSRVIFFTITTSKGCG